MASAKEKSDPEKPPITGDGQIFSFLSQISLYLTVIVVFIAQTRIESRDIRILYSLCMVIGSAVGSYGTNLTYYATKHPKDLKNKISPWWAYTILLIFGLLGLIV
jgi:hypothetical protein